jgi:hypothetical protein
MTYESNCTLPNELLVQIANEGLGCLPELIRTMTEVIQALREFLLPLLTGLSDMTRFDQIWSPGAPWIEQLNEELT